MINPKYHDTLSLQHISKTISRPTTSPLTLTLFTFLSFFFPFPLPKLTTFPHTPFHHPLPSNFVFTFWPLLHSFSGHASFLSNCLSPGPVGPPTYFLNPSRFFPFCRGSSAAYSASPQCPANRRKDVGASGVGRRGVKVPSMGAEVVCGEEEGVYV